MDRSSGTGCNPQNKSYKSLLSEKYALSNIDGGRGEGDRGSALQGGENHGILKKTPGGGTMWKDSPRTVRKMVLRLSTAGAVLALGGALVQSALLIVAGLLLLIVALVLHFTYYRCPHCSRFLDRSDGEYCPYCGKKME